MEDVRHVQGSGSRESALEIRAETLDLPLTGSRLGADTLRALLERPTLLVFLRHGG